MALDKLLDEADLKRGFLTRVEDGLTPEQRDIVFPEASRDLRVLDMFSPALMFSETAKLMTVESEADLRSKLMQRTGGLLRLTAEQLSRIFEPGQWLELQPKQPK